MNLKHPTNILNALATLVLVASVLLGAGSVTAKEAPSAPGISPAVAAAQPDGPSTAIAHAARDGILVEPQGTLLALPVTDMPDDAVVAGIDLKVSVAGAPAGELRIQVAAPDGAWVDIPLQPAAVSVPGDAKAAPDGGQVDVATTAGTIHALDGKPGLGTWTVKLSPADRALAGKTASFSLAIRYTTSYAWPVQVDGDGWLPAMESLPAPIWELSTPTGGEQDQKPASTADEPASPNGWVTLKSETFEGSFPNTGWTVVDYSGDGYERFWDDDDYKPYGGSWSAWPANGGANGLDPQYYYYPNNMNTWMVYGPFDLSNATNARTIFHMWHEIETVFDYVYFGVSANGTSFDGVRWDGLQPWTEYTVNYAPLVGDSSVWVGWKFYSDGSVFDDGPFVDSIDIQKNIACGPYADAGGWEIPDDGSWLVVPLADRMAPDEGTVTEVNVKYLLNHPDPSQLEIKLAKAGSPIEQTLWNRGELVAGTQPGAALGLTAFAGAPAVGEWQLLVRDLSPGQQGRLAAASVRALYTPLEPALTVVKGPPGRVSSLKLPADARRLTAPDGEKPVSAVPAAARQPDGWQVIKTEGFEGAFPNTGWTLTDLSNDGCDFLWDDDVFKPHVGSWAAWPANGGVDGLDPAVSNYPPNMNSWMVYGPFSLAGATNADTLFSLWRQIEPTFDWVAFGASHDGTNFTTAQWDGTASWTDIQVNYGSFVGDSSVWVAWIFHSDSSVQLDGPWVDEIAIRKFVPVNCGPFDDAGDWQIPDDGSWLAVPLADRTAPDQGAVVEVNVKYLLDHPDPSQLEVKLAKAGSGVEQFLWNRGELVVGPEPGAALGLTTFAGAPAAGEWQLLVRDLVPGQQGRLAAASVRALYTPLGDAPTVVKGPPGRVSAFKLPAGASGAANPESGQLAPMPDSAVQPAGWQFIRTEGFEGVFPSSGWALLDLSNDGCNFLWDKDDFKPHVGSQAGWPANGGTNGLDPAVSNYPPNMESWMVYGPFSLVGATDAETLFSLWRQIELNFDYIAFGVSHDGTNFNGVEWDGTVGWTDIQVNYQSYVGDSSVWVVWVFHSDGSNQFDGPWVDEIGIRKFVQPTIRRFFLPSNLHGASQ